MSLQFSNTTTKNGIIQHIERNCGFNDGDISSNPTLLAQFTADVNTALDEVTSLIFQVGGTWQYDDSNHPEYPIITTSIVSGQRDYPFTTDESGNLILDIQKVLVADSNGLFRELTPVDVPSGAPANYWDGLNTGGIPNSYEKNANGIFLDPIPNYNRSAGLKIYISREGSYFSTDDTTKKPGFAGLFHEYLALRPAYFYCMRNGKQTATSLEKEMEKMKLSIMDYYKLREKDVVKRLSGAYSSSK